jgi:hypothetical protein
LLHDENDRPLTVIYNIGFTAGFSDFSSKNTVVALPGDSIQQTPIVQVLLIISKTVHINALIIL